MPKRGNHEGYVYKNTRGHWIARMQIGWQENGKPKLKTFSAKTRNSVLKRLENYKAQVNQEKTIDECKSTLQCCLESWVDNVKSIELKPTSIDRLKNTIRNNIVPYIGHLYIEDINAQIIQKQLINPLINSGLSYSTVKKVRDALNNFFNGCIIKRTLTYNPVNGVVLPKQNLMAKNKNVIRSLDSNEIERFIQVATAKYVSNDKNIYRHGYGYLFILYTGLRCGEALGLQYKHLDLEKRTLTITQSVVFVSNKSETGPQRVAYVQNSLKSQSSQRQIYMCDKALYYIKEHMKLYYKGNPEDFVFLTSKGKLMNNRSFERNLNAIYSATNINATGLHILRHTMASLMLSKGIDIKYISNFLGHSSAGFTYNYYIHIIKELEEKSNEALNKI